MPVKKTKKSVKKKAIKSEECNCDIESNCCKDFNSACKGGCMYGLGVVGAAVYFISTTTGFWMGVLGILKALVWPGFLVYGQLKFFGL